MANQQFQNHWISSNFMLPHPLEQFNAFSRFDYNFNMQSTIS